MEENKAAVITKIENVLIQGDLSRLTPDERIVYYKNVCESMGLNPLTQPLDYVQLNGKLVLYAKKGATDQLRRINGVSITKLDQEERGDYYYATAHARDASGREDADTGVVFLGGTKGEQRSNAILKAITKAKRRVTLSISGLGLLDELEVDSIPSAQKINAQVAQITEQKKDAIKATLEAEPKPSKERAAADMFRFLERFNNCRTLQELKEDFKDFLAFCESPAAMAIPPSEFETMKMELVALKDSLKEKLI